MERRLGRGLESLLGGASTASSGGGGAEPDGGGGPRLLPVQKVRPNPNQPRKVFDSVLLDELRDSIKTHGVLQPICVRAASGGTWEIVAGERRWRAARLAGLQEIPATILDAVEDQGMTELALVENLQRADLDPIEKARAFHVLVEDLGLTQERVAERVGLKRSSVANHLRLLDLPNEAQEALITGLITMGHAKVLLGLEPGAIRELLGRIVREDLSVRALEVLVKDRRSEPAGGPTPPATPRTTQAPAPWVRSCEERLRSSLGTRVELREGRGQKGRIVVHYHDREELERLLEALAPGDRLE